MHFFPEAFNVQTPRVFGRHSAGRGFFEGYIRHAGVDKYYCCTPKEQSFAIFSASAGEICPTTPTEWIPYSQLQKLAKVGCLYQPDPHIAALSWHRRRLGSNALSLCGVTHTLCTMAIMDSLGELLVAPIEPWDALICTSQAAKSAVEHVLGTFREYLSSKFTCDVPICIELPVIPLGVDCDFFERSESTSFQGAQIRKQLGIADEDVAVLYVGRLNPNAKAHPLSMYLAVEEVARRTGDRLHLLHFGWFSNPEVKKQFMTAAHLFCPSVKCHFVDEPQEWYQAIWHAADIFVSFCDNIQETFGLTPLEAMAAGLPQVVSDWDGYRDTVRHGIDGFRAPTIAPPPGAGDELVARYSTGIDNYDRYVGNASQSTAIDLESCVLALERLVSDKALRKSMGQAGQQRAREQFDWRIVIKNYQALWRELQARREAAKKISRGASALHPLREDPFAVFSRHPTRVLSPDTTLAGGANIATTRVQMIAALPMNISAAHLMCSAEEIMNLVMEVKAAPRLPLSNVLLRTPIERHARMYRTVGWLIKTDVIRIVGDDVPLL